MLAAVNGCFGVFHLVSPCIVDQVHDPEVRAKGASGAGDQRNAQCSDSVLAPPSFEKEAIQMVKPAKGTTSLAFIFKDGVMVAADSRASMDGYIYELLLGKDEDIATGQVEGGYDRPE
ncbi:hypothetical protein C1H46_028065 [Malus baccata]|uniref:Proteasome endopeptidase complex n=1 Tax=Malus baccata TaxID=106549 RepID=A0A540LIT1_MALBA|nr:hypothetical protein C1H46_028065 [Malus baccata]